jgi:hypothetical protein
VSGELRLLGGAGRQIRPLFDALVGPVTTHVDGTVETLFTYTVPAGLLAANGDKIRCKFLGDVLAAAAPTALRQIGLSAFGGVLFVAGPYTSTNDGSWEINIDFMRIDSTTVVYQVTGIFHQDDVSTPGDNNPVFAGNDTISGKDLAGTAYTINCIARVSGAGAAPGDIGFRQGSTGMFIPAAAS